MQETDHFDRAILRELQQDCRQSSERIAATVSLSPTAVQRRIKRMRENGVIIAEQAIVNPAAIDNQLRILIQVCLAQGRLDFVADFKRKALATPEVQQCYYVTGEYDFLLIVTVANMEKYEQLCHRLFFDNTSIQKFHTFVVMEAVKASLNINIPS
jgi:Lrp/AsnC family leucine-responsive transcriptional regulator